MEDNWTQSVLKQISKSSSRTELKPAHSLYKSGKRPEQLGNKSPPLKLTHPLYKSRKRPEQLGNKSPPQPESENFWQNSSLYKAAQSFQNILTEKKTKKHENDAVAGAKSKKQSQPPVQNRSSNLNKRADNQLGFPSILTPIKIQPAPQRNQYGQHGSGSQQNSSGQQGFDSAQPRKKIKTKPKLYSPINKDLLKDFSENMVSPSRSLGIQKFEDTKKSESPGRKFDHHVIPIIEDAEIDEHKVIPRFEDAQTEQDEIDILLKRKRELESIKLELQNRYKEAGIDDIHVEHYAKIQKLKLTVADDDLGIESAILDLADWHLDFSYYQHRQDWLSRKDLQVFLGYIQDALKHLPIAYHQANEACVQLFYSMLLASFLGSHEQLVQKGLKIVPQVKVKHKITGDDIIPDLLLGIKKINHSKKQIRGASKPFTEHRPRVVLEFKRILETNEIEDATEQTLNYFLHFTSLEDEGRAFAAVALDLHRARIFFRRYKDSPMRIFNLNWHFDEVLAILKPQQSSITSGFNFPQFYTFFIFLKILVSKL